MPTTTTSIPPVTINDEQTLPFTLAPVDSAGKPQPLASPPVWTLSVATGTPLSTITPAADGLSAVLTSGSGPEVVTVQVQAEGDATPGVDTLVQTCVVTVTSAEDVTLGLTSGTPATKS